ncbi:hypothetical protein FOZ63_016739 [Perkinsus olseni]|uniref:Uncharacterized protein n=1 Tax=Perkinsus olseni TaxID=32597 RepID=A0A7J6SJV5_PEROL|nr:hypothetical protein FOZ63_016739 [Perkinsus olseni]
MASTAAAPPTLSKRHLLDIDTVYSISPNNPLPCGLPEPRMLKRRSDIVHPPGIEPGPHARHPCSVVADGDNPQGDPVVAILEAGDNCNTVK